MNRGIQYAGQVPLDTDILAAQQNAMIGLGYVTQMLAGTSVAAIGLPCTPTAPPSMTVNIGAGAMTGLTEVDPVAYGDLGANTAALVKMGINLGSVPFTLTAPGTSGQSINYLIEGEFQEEDGTAIVLPYYNSADPNMPFAGPNNTGTAQNTIRAQIVGLQLKAGAAATTGTQTTPAVDAGWSPLYIITVNFGQTTITAGNITVAPGAPFFSIQPTTKTEYIEFGTSGNVSASQILRQFVAYAATTISAGCPLSQGYASTAATASATCTITKTLAGGGATTSVGTVVFGAGGTIATFTAGSDIVLAAGDILLITGPLTADATLAGVSGGLVAQVAQ